MAETRIRKAITLARSARAKGNHPFGALLVCDGQVLLEAENTVVTDRDCTRHAELNLVSEASRRFDPGTLARSVLYASTEPCPMCAGAIYWAGIRQVVFGLRTTELAKLAGGGLAIPCREILGRGSEAIGVAGPVLEAEAEAVHDGFWK